jgi:rRNA-processing protein FCF1
MNKNTLINDGGKRMRIFQSLMSTIMIFKSRTQDEILQELKELEKKGKLKIYYPEHK